MTNNIIDQMVDIVKIIDAMTKDIDPGAVDSEGKLQNLIDVYASVSVCYRTLSALRSRVGVMLLDKLTHGVYETDRYALHVSNAAPSRVTRWKEVTKDLRQFVPKEKIERAIARNTTVTYPRVRLIPSEK